MAVWSRWVSLSEKFNRRNLRERILLGFSVLAVTFLLLDIILIQPNLRVEKKLVKNITHAEKMRLDKTEQLVKLSKLRQADPVIVKNREISLLRNQLDSLNEDFNALSIGLVSAQKLPLVIRDMLDKTDGVKFLALQAQAPKSLTISDPVVSEETEFDPETDAAGTKVFKHSVFVAVEGRYHDVVSFLEVEPIVYREIELTFGAEYLYQPRGEFRLQSIIMYSGDPHNMAIRGSRGHYIAIIRDATNSFWEYDDVHTPRMVRIEDPTKIPQMLTNVPFEGDAKQNSYLNVAGNQGFSPTLLLYRCAAAPAAAVRPGDVPEQKAGLDRVLDRVDKLVDITGLGKVVDYFYPDDPSDPSDEDEHKPDVDMDDQSDILDVYTDELNEIIIKGVNGRDEDKPYWALIYQMKQYLPRALEKLKRDRKKPNHLAWLVFPTETPAGPFVEVLGVRPAVPKEYQTDLFLKLNAPKEWKEILEFLVLNSQNGCTASGPIIPRQDHERAREFVQLWRPKSTRIDPWFNNVLKDMQGWSYLF